MESQLQEGLALADSEPKAEIVRFNVDGVAFGLDISLLSPQAQRTYRILSERGNLYEPVMTRCLTKLITQMEQPRFMDLGSSAGYYACYVATLLGNYSRPVVAIESNPTYCEGIRRSGELNGLRNLKVYDSILSDVAAPAEVDRFTVMVGNAAGESAKTAIALDELCRREAIHLPNIVKIDIHGGEGRALFGMTSVLRKVDYLLLELHGQDRLDEFSGGTRRSAIMKLLWESGLSVYYIAGHTVNPKQANREIIRSGRFAYRLVTPENVDCLMFDRLWHVFLLATPRNDLQEMLGESSDDSFLCY
jgi:FkbM family methyltransferase